MIWKPISTIPTDGRWVLVSGQFIAIRRHSFANEPGKLFDQQGKECLKRWTHWQPLPPLPNASPSSLHAAKVRHTKERK